MFERRLQKMLKAEEMVVLIVRRYLLVFTGSMVGAALFVLVPFFFLVPLFRLGWIGVGIFSLGLLIGVILSIRIVIMYVFNAFVITEDRIIDIDQGGLFDRTVSETTYDKIQDVSVRVRGIMQTVFHYGSVIIQTAGTQANIELHGVKDPEHVQQTIIGLQRDTAASAASDIADNDPEDA